MNPIAAVAVLVLVVAALPPAAAQSQPQTPGGEAKVASPEYDNMPQGYPFPWFAPGEGYYPKPGKKRRGLFGKRWFQPYGPQGYYYRPRGISPRDY